MPSNTIKSRIAGPLFFAGAAALAVAGLNGNADDTAKEIAALIGAEAAEACGLSDALISTREELIAENYKAEGQILSPGSEFENTMFQALVRVDFAVPDDSGSTELTDCLRDLTESTAKTYLDKYPDGCELVDLRVGEEKQQWHSDVEIDCNILKLLSVTD
jgi:hypothetical protein